MSHAPRLWYASLDARGASRAYRWASSVLRMPTEKPPSLPAAICPDVLPGLAQSKTYSCGNGVKKSEHTFMWRAPIISCRMRVGSEAEGGFCCIRQAAQEGDHCDEKRFIQSIVRADASPADVRDGHRRSKVSVK